MQANVEAILVPNGSAQGPPRGLLEPQHVLHDGVRRELHGKSGERRGRAPPRSGAPAERLKLSRRAAIVFSLMPPTRSTFPVKVSSPAKRARGGDSRRARLLGPGRAPPERERQPESRPLCLHEHLKRTRADIVLLRRGRRNRFCEVCHLACETKADEG